MTNALSIALTLAFLCLPAAGADTNPFIGKPSGRILAAGDNRIALFSPTGQILWEHPTKLTHDAWMLPSGNILFGDGQSITEITPDKKIVFQYRPESRKNDAVYACQRLSNGNTLIGENTTGRVLEVDPTGRVIFTLQTQPAKEGNHQNLRMVRKLANGNYLVCHSGAHLVKEYMPAGNVVLEIKTPNLAFAAIRTPQGTTLISSLDQITEHNADGSKAWEFTIKDVPGMAIRNLTALHLLPNGNILAGCYAAYDKAGDGCGMLEITRDKKIAWRFINPGFARTTMAVQLLDMDGKPLAGAAMR